MRKKVIRRGNNSNSTYINNRLLSLDIVRRFGPISKSEIARLIGLTPMAANNIINDLYELQLIKSVTVGKSTGGRRPILYSMDPGNRVCISIDMSSDEIIMGLVDVTGDIRVSKKFEAIPQESTRVLTLVNAISDFINKQVRGTKLEVIGIGVALPGIVDSQSGFVKISVPLNWRDVPLRTILEQTFPYPVSVGKETHAAIAGEYHFGAADGAVNSLYINIGAGIGVGIMVGGQVYRGENQMSGELGHIIVESGGRLCECGNRGCLEKMASMRALVEKAKEAASNGISPWLAGVMREHNGQLSIRDFLDAVEAGDEASIQILDNAVEYLVRGIIMLKRLFDPEIIVIGGNALEEGKPYCREVLRKLKEFNSILDEGTNIRFSGLGERARLLGASVWAFSRYFESLLTGSKNGCSDLKA